MKFQVSSSGLSTFERSWYALGRGVRDISVEDKADAARFPFDEAAEMKNLGASGPHGEESFSTLERRWGAYHTYIGYDPGWQLGGVHAGFNAATAFCKL